MRTTCRRTRRITLQRVAHERIRLHLPNSSCRDEHMGSRALRAISALHVVASPQGNTDDAAIDALFKRGLGHARGQGVGLRSSGVPAQSKASSHFHLSGLGCRSASTVGRGGLSVSVAASADESRHGCKQDSAHGADEEPEGLTLAQFQSLLVSDSNLAFNEAKMQACESDSHL